MEASIDVARRLHDRGGGSAASEALAEFLGYSGTRNGTYINRLSSARLFGLVEGPPSAISLTPRARDILMPDYPAVAEQARLEAFFGVPLYGEFFKEYGGRQLPPTDGMVNSLANKFQVPAAQAKVALTRLLDSAEQAGLFAVAGSRSKMIRPSAGPVRQGGAGEGAIDAAPRSLDLPKRREEVSHSPDRYPKLIEGALEQLPREGESWEESQMEEWFELFKMAIRVAYRTTIKQGMKAHEGASAKPIPEPE